MKEQSSVSVSVLVIEGDEQLSSLVIEAGRTCHLVNSLEDGLRQLETTSHEVVLLDLRASEEKGLESIGRLASVCPDTSLVVVVDRQEDGLIEGALRRGATEVVAREALSCEQLNRQIRMAEIRNRHLLDRLHDDEAEQWTPRGRSTASPGASARLYGSRPLRERSRDLLLEFADDLRQAVRLSWHERRYRVDGKATTKLRSLATRLVGIGASARDVMDVHRAMLEESPESATDKRTGALVRESRYLLLELMGLIVNVYRAHWMGGRRLRPSSSPQEANGQPIS